MAIRIVPLSAELRPAVEAFNLRMHAGGSTWGIHIEPESSWLLNGEGPTVWREKHVAIDDKGAVLGGFNLKPQAWLIRGDKKIVTDWQGPVSEGSVNPKYAALAVRLMREMTKRRPALFSWGHGDNDQPLVLLLRKMNWPIHEAPFCLLVLKPFRFLRLNGYLRRSKVNRIASDFMAYTGLGSIALHALHLALRLKSLRLFGATASTFDRFEAWADALWERCKGSYTAIAYRDANNMNLLAPQSGWPPVTRLRIEKNGKTIGWSLVMNTRMDGDARFGDLHVGSVVDCFADPQDAGEVVWASTRFLRARNVDIVVSNQSHTSWVKGFSESGYLVLPKRRLFVASPALHDLLEPFAQTVKGLHLTNMDGHGPHSL